MTFWILLVIAVTLSFLSLRYYNLLFSLCAALGWLAIWMYNLNNPPAGITIGTSLHDLLTYTFIVMAIAIMLTYFMRGNKVLGGKSRSSFEAQDNARRMPENRGLMDMSQEEYRARVNRALHNRRER